jgi:hypothetical protein
MSGLYTGNIIRFYKVYHSNSLTGNYQDFCIFLTANDHVDVLSDVEEVRTYFSDLF